MHSGPCPDDGRRTKPLIHHRLVFDVGVVIQIHETALADTPVGGDRHGDEEQHNRRRGLRSGPAHSADRRG